MNIIKAIILTCVVILITFGFSKVVHANDSAIELEKISIEYRNFFEGSQEPLISDNIFMPNRRLDKEISLNLNMNIFEYLYWNNRVEGMTDAPTKIGGDFSQFRTVAWEFHFGIALFDFLNFEYKHRSRHTLDTIYQNAFPVQDSLGIELIIFSKSRQRSFF